jgi:hypothetical protein
MQFYTKIYIIHNFLGRRLVFTPFLLLAGTIINPEGDPKLFSKHKMYCFLHFRMLKIRVRLKQKQDVILIDCGLARFGIKRLNIFELILKIKDQNQNG